MACIQEPRVVRRGLLPGREVRTSNRLGQAAQGPLIVEGALSALLSRRAGLGELPDHGDGSLAHIRWQRPRAAGRRIHGHAHELVLAATAPVASLLISWVKAIDFAETRRTVERMAKRSPARNSRRYWTR